ncbi:MAG: class I SAM-dependent methyltransferase [Byssovorax sp.]
MNDAGLAPIVCPTCRARLVLRATRPAPAGREIEAGRLDCQQCGAAWTLEDGLPRLYREDAVRGTDRLMRVFYDGLPSLHDPLTRHLLPLLEAGGSEAALRDGYMKRIDLASLTPAPDGRPLRILEIGVGAGANLPLVQRDLPRGLDVEIWGLDLSVGMLRQCRKRLARFRGPPVHLLVGDAHALPFPDQTFDRVFHVGAMGSFRDGRRVLAEMTRVAVPGTPIVVVDEQLDPGRAQRLHHRLAFRLLTFYDASPHCPIELLPSGVTHVLEEAISRFYYCLSFRAPQPTR